MRDLSPALKIRPIINYPRVARTGERYLMTIDIQLAEAGASWNYPEEEYEVAFILNTGPYFRYEALDKSKEGVVLHRFGGTYGPAQYVLTANQEEVRLGQIGITMINKWGLPIAHVALECEVRRNIEQAKEIIIIEQEKRGLQKSSMLVDKDG
jgi:hypothetical protein